MKERFNLESVKMEDIHSLSQNEDEIVLIMIEKWVIVTFDLI